MTNARTLHEEVAELVLEEMLRSPEAAGVLMHHRDLFSSGAFDRTYAARIGQTQWEPSSWPLEQVAAYVKVHAGLMAGRYAKVEISVGADPGPDADRVENAAKLRGVHAMFRAELDMTQNGADSDGDLSWGNPIEVNKSTGLGLIDHGETNPIMMGRTLRAGTVPLEVGTTKPSRTLMHLEMDGGVARWPYFDDRICLLVNVAPDTRLGAARPVRTAA